MVTHTSTPNQSLEEGGLIIISELILVRIPVAEGDQLLEASTTVATEIPQPSQPQRRRPPQHHAFIRSVTPHPLGLTLEVYPILSFSREGGAVNGYNAASESVKRGLIPLPPLSSTFPTPPLFGTRLLIGGWVNSKDAFISVYPVTFELRRSSKFKKFIPRITLSDDELVRIDTYLLANRPLDQGGHLALALVTKVEKGLLLLDRIMKRRMEGGSIQKSLRATLCCEGGAQNRTAKEAQDGNATDILSESSDECRSPTIKDDLILLAHSHPSWIPELEKYLEAERAELQAEGILKVESWLDSLQGLVL